MKTFLKKLLVVCAVIFATVVATNLQPSGSANAAGCNNFLGLNSWDCNIVDWTGGEASLKTNVLIISANILTDITVLAAYLVIGFVIYGGYQYILASGDPSKVAAGKKTLLHAFIGLAIVLLSSVILNTIRIAIMGSATGGFTNCANSQCVSGADMVSNVIGWVIGVGGLVAVIFIFIGGIGYMTSAGDPSKLQKAKHTILYACIGLIIVALSLSITAFVTNLINSSKDNSDGQNNDGSVGYIYNQTKESHEIKS